jgi:large subunit ribosomal protein L22
MQGVCHGRFIRYSPKKIAQVLKIIRGKKVSDVFNILNNINKSFVDDLKKAIKSALSNAKGLKEPDKFYLTQCYVTKGPYLKRIMPKAFGRAALFTRKMTHLTVVVSNEKNKKEK